MKIERINQKNIYKYDENAKNYGTIFDTIKWLSLFDNVLIYGIFDDGNNLIGGFHLLKEKKYGITIVRNPPFTPFIGPFYKNEAKNTAKVINKNREIIALIADHFKKERYPIITISLARNIIDTLPFIWEKYKVTARYTYIINLNYPKEELHSNLSPERRNDINRAKKYGVIVKRESNYNIVKKLVIKTFSRQGKKIKEEYLDNILFTFANDSNSYAYTVYIDNRPVSTVFCVFDKTQAFYLLGGYDSEFSHRGAGVLAMWEAISHAKDLGLRYFDFEGSIVPQIEKYFRGFGGALTPYFNLNKAYFPLELALKMIKREMF
jgi:lipid II:glycine glycyltransferase (peptidoglycan interpeptide bridge formation enzyme)